MAEMQANATPAVMAAITAAVTPVVMISANAILIGTISAKHQAMSERVRALAAEWRTPDSSAARRETIGRQCRLFQQRIAWVGRAHFLLYVATGCFISMVMVIAITPVTQTWAVISLPLLLTGVFLMLIAIVLELLDLSRARATLEIDTADVLPTLRK
jgi:hypothetical protein